MRYLAIIQVNSKSGDSVCEEVLFSEQSQTFSINGWNIKAEMDVAQTASIVVYDKNGTASFVSRRALEINGRNYNGKVTGSSKLIEIIR